MVGYAGDSRSSGAHGRQVGPLVSVRVEYFHAVHALLAIEAPGYVDFIWTKIINVKIFASTFQDI